MKLADDPEAQVDQYVVAGREFHALWFSCPAHPENGYCAFRIPFEYSTDTSYKPPALPDGRVVWRATGTFPETLSLHPSVNVLGDTDGAPSHWHGWVTNGVAS